uniref:Uncharacterized protein n=1 Tax=Strigamia maritima TaxID=126957 RepID=T1ILL4_STRMM
MITPHLFQMIKNSKGYLSVECNLTTDLLTKGSILFTQNCACAQQPQVKLKTPSCVCVPARAFHGSRGKNNNAKRSDKEGSMLSFWCGQAVSSTRGQCSNTGKELAEETNRPATQKHYINGTANRLKKLFNRASTRTRQIEKSTSNTQISVSEIREKRRIFLHIFLVSGVFLSCFWVFLHIFLVSGISANNS